MKDDTKYITVHIRMNDKEKNTIKKRADLAGKNFSEFIRMSAMGCEIREKADKEFSSTMKKQMRDFIRTLCELERLLYNKDFIDERVLNNEILEWRKFRMNIITVFFKKYCNFSAFSLHHSPYSESFENHS